MSSIFLSHSHQDKEFARKIASDLRHAGHIVWIDEAEIRIGDSLIGKIRDGLDRVDYVAAILSKASINSSWVKRELDIASNREIDEDRVVVLPIVLEDVELPGFLKGKFYGDFSEENKYDQSFQRLLRSLGPTELAPALDDTEARLLRAELAKAKTLIEHYTREQERKNLAISSNWSTKLRDAVTQANNKFPQHKLVNEAYAFEANGIPITLDYVLSAFSREDLDFGTGIKFPSELFGNIQEVHLMIEAYNDYMKLDSTSG